MNDSFVFYGKMLLLSNAYVTSLARCGLRGAAAAGDGGPPIHVQLPGHGVVRPQLLLPLRKRGGHSRARREPQPGGVSCARYACCSPFTPEVFLQPRVHKIADFSNVLVDVEDRVGCRIMIATAPFA